MSERPKTIDAWTWRELATEVEGLRDKVAQLEAAVEKLTEELETLRWLDREQPHE